MHGCFYGENWTIVYFLNEEGLGWNLEIRDVLVLVIAKKKVFNSKINNKKQNQSILSKWNAL